MNTTKREITAWAIASLAVLLLIGINLPQCGKKSAQKTDPVVEDLRKPLDVEASTKPAEPDADMSRLDAAPAKPAPTAETAPTAPTADRFSLFVGTWEGNEHKPLPTLTMVEGRPGSKTPFNFRFRLQESYGILEGGCGVYGELAEPPAKPGESYCVVHDPRDPPNLRLGKKVHTMTKLTIVMGQLPVTKATFEVEGLFTATLVRAMTDPNRPKRLE